MRNSKYSPIHQLVHTLSYGDAISGEVLALRRALRDLGVESEIYSLHTHPKLEGESRSIEDFPKNDSAAQVILHYSLGSPLNDLYREIRSDSKTLIYHNLTPAKWFSGINPRITSDIRQGEAELPELLALSTRIIADSTFNADEIREKGFEADVLPLPIDPERWSMKANEGIVDLVRNTPGPHLLHVGRLAPNKCIEDIIRAFYFFRNHISKNARLWLVGIDIDTELYSFSLKHMVHQLGLSEAVEFPGCMADSEVRALYENADLYLCMSEHEGFCLPVIEAMHFGLPVIAYHSSALPETISEGGVLVKKKDPAFLAALFAQILSSQEMQNALIVAGKKRVKQLSYSKFASHVESLFLNGFSSDVVSEHDKKQKKVG